MLKLSTVTLLRALEHYGDPKSLAADPDAAEQLGRWGECSSHRVRLSGSWRRRGRAWVCGLGNGSGARSKNTPVKRYRAAAGQRGGTAVARVGRRE